MARPKTNQDGNTLFDAVTNRDGLVCFMCGAVHSRSATMQLDWMDYDDVDVTNPEDAILACKTCVRRRDKRPLLAYLKTRLSAALAEVAHLSVLPEDIRIKKLLTRPIHYAPRITEDTPDAVGVTGHVGPVLTRPSRLYCWSNMKIEDLDKPDLNTGKPKDRQHKDIFVDNWNNQDEYLVWDATFENKNDNPGRWRPLDDCVAEGVVPEGWESDESLAIWPDVEP